MRDYKGPWHVSSTYNLQIDDCNNETIAYTETCVGHEKDMANAQLIAAAPDMLKLLIDLVMWNDDDHDIIVNGIVEQADALIKELES